MKVLLAVAIVSVTVGWVLRGRRERPPVLDRESWTDEAGWQW